jgi:hypothetical protein
MGPVGRVVDHRCFAPIIPPRRTRPYPLMHQHLEPGPANAHCPGATLLQLCDRIVGPHARTCPTSRSRIGSRRATAAPRSLVPRQMTDT